LRGWPYKHLPVRWLPFIVKSRPSLLNSDGTLPVMTVSATSSKDLILPW
jgi:hypothetical protein